MKKVFVNGYGSIGRRIAKFIKDDSDIDVIDADSDSDKDTKQPPHEAGNGNAFTKISPAIADTNDMNNKHVCYLNES